MRMFLGMENLDDIYSDYTRPFVGRLLKLLKLDLNYISGEGDFLAYFDSEKNQTNRVLDLLGGYGSTLLGHSHPEMIAALSEQLKNKVPLHAQMSLRGNAARLSLALSKKLQKETKSPDHWITTFCSSGAEASEASMKHALIQWKHKQARKILELRKARSALFHRDPKAAEISTIESAIKNIAKEEPVLFAIRGSFHSMSAANPCKIVYLDQNQSTASLEAVFKSFFGKIIGVIYEPVQGEGGMGVLSKAFVQSINALTSEQSIPLIADEVESGLYRTGNFLASTKIGLNPSYVLLGKGLGGAVTKIAALSVRASLYQAEFGFVHTSTFAEDDHSCAVALHCLDFLEARAEELKEKAAHFEKKIRMGVEKIQYQYPGVIKEVRGQGLMLGIVFNFSEDAPISRFLSSIYQAGFASFVFTSYLLHQHQVRVGGSLGSRDTIRIEPSAWITDASIDQALKSFETLAEILFHRQYVKLTAHFWRQTFTESQLNVQSPKQTPIDLNSMRSRDIKKIGFFTHLIDDEKFQTLDPLIRELNRSERERFQEKFGPLTGAFNYHEQIIRGKNGEETLLVCYGLFLPSAFFEKSLRAGDGHAFRQVEAATLRAAADGMDLVGLGQFTSIVTENGCLVDELGVSVTTGNSLTAGFACQALALSMKEKGRSLSNAHVGVVGAAGNICNVITQILADEVAELTLVFREDPKNDPKAERAIQNILRNSKIDPAKIRATSNISELAKCDAIVMGTNTAKQFLLPEHCKQNAVVLDISVPSNIDPRVLKERLDVQCFQGGMAKLPGDQFIESVWVPSPKGEVFACMGEAIASGLANISGHVSLGPLSKAKVLEVTQMAESVGMTVGSLRRMTAHD